MKPRETLSDQELIAITLSYDTTAFDVLILRWHASILRYTSRLLNFNTADSEDVTSEAFYKAYRNLASYNPKYSFSSWLYRIAHNQAVNLIRKNSGFFSMDIQGFLHIPSQESQIIEQKFTHKDLEQVLQKLSVKDRNVLVLFYLEEKSLREIGNILKLNDNTVAKQLSRARKKAQNIIQSS
jgi:RNA polymerase sigma-70 factor, ECF subfamily